MKLQTPMFFSWRFRNRPFFRWPFLSAPPTKRLMGKWAPTKANRGPPASRFFGVSGYLDGVISSCKQTLRTCWKYRPPGRMMKIGSWGSIIPAAELQPVEEIPALRSLSWSLWKIVARCSGQTQNSSVHGKMTTFSEKKKTPSKQTLYTPFTPICTYTSAINPNISTKNLQNPGLVWTNFGPGRLFWDWAPAHLPESNPGVSGGTWELPTYNSKSIEVATQNEQTKQVWYVVCYAAKKNKHNWCKLNKNYRLYIYIYIYAYIYIYNNLRKTHRLTHHQFNSSTEPTLHPQSCPSLGPTVRSPKVPSASSRNLCVVSDDNADWRVEYVDSFLQRHIHLWRCAWKEAKYIGILHVRAHETV